MGHHPNECPTRKEVHFVEDEEGEQELLEDPNYGTYDMVYQVMPAQGGQPVQYFPKASGQVSNYNTPEKKPPMGPPGGYPPRGSLPRGVCWNCGDPKHFLDRCPYPKRNDGFVLLCGNCGKEGHKPAECPDQPKPKMLVRYVQEPLKQQPKPAENVRLVYYEANDEEECILVQDDQVRHVHSTTFIQEQEAEHLESGEKKSIIVPEVVPTRSVLSFKTPDGIIFDKEVPYLIKPEEWGQPNKRVKERDRILNVYAATRSKKKKLEKSLDKERHRKAVTEEDLSDQVPVNKKDRKDDLEEGYDQNHPKYYLPDISAEVREMLAQELKHVTQKFDLQAAKVAPMAEVSELLKPPYNIWDDINNYKANISLGELIRSNAHYKRQIRKGAGIKRKKGPLPIVEKPKKDEKKLPAPEDKVKKVQFCFKLETDKGQPELTVEIAGCTIPKVPVDGGSSVNLMTEPTAFSLGFEDFKPADRVLRMADQSRVIPVGVLHDVTTLIGGIPFLLTYIIIRPTSPSTYPVLLGRPWLYGANVKVNWSSKEFSFGNPRTVISWNLDKYQGETQPGEEYTSGTTDTSSDEEEATTESEEDWSVKLIQDFPIRSKEISLGIRKINVPDVTVVTVFSDRSGHPEPDLKVEPELTSGPDQKIQPEPEQGEGPDPPEHI